MDFALLLQLTEHLVEKFWTPTGTVPSAAAAHGQKDQNSGETEVVGRYMS